MLIARGEREHRLQPKMLNRHGLITGATGTGKTVTLRVIAEQLSELGVPVFMADIKGDLSGISKPGTANERLAARAQELGTELRHEKFPAVYWDLYGKQGHPIRATVSDLGPLLLSRLLSLNDTQEGVLNLIFKIADDHSMLLLDLKDLRAMAQHVGDNAAAFRTQYGNVSAASIGAIQRNLLTLETQGADQFFGEPMLNLDDLIQTDERGRGVINILAADQLINAPKVYAKFLLWLMAELFENLPEVGDLEKPKLVFFFDEAHLLFTDAPPALVQKVEQLVRLIRSKGVGVYFVTQNPLDIPVSVLAQLGNRVQHALRAFTPLDQKAVRSAAQTFRQNPKLDIEKAITELKVGEALVSFLDANGAPEVVDRALIYPPQSQLPPITPGERQQFIAQSPVAGVYDKTVDRESAYEMLKARAAQAPQPAAPTRPPARTPPSTTEVLVKSFGQSAARAMGSQVGRSIMRGLFGSLLGSSGRRRR